ncbi:MAG: outer membrane beta-barrel protein [Treponema sp.]|nr:outer membrane beta-barrel protein [Treponema sp.]
MKKILLSVLTACLLLSGLNAKSSKKSSSLDLSLDVNYALPMVFQHSETDISTTDTFQFGMGVDTGVSLMLTDRLGAKVDVGFEFPQTNKGTTKIGSLEVTVNEDYRDYDKNFRFSLFFGPKINIINSRSYTLGISPGFLFQSWAVKAGSVEGTITYWGFGGEIDATYTVSGNIYANLSVPVVWLYSMKVDDRKPDDISYWLIKPKIGVGYRF